MKKEPIRPSISKESYQHQEKIIKELRELKKEQFNIMQVAFQRALERVKHG